MMPIWFCCARPGGANRIATVRHSAPTVGAAVDGGQYRERNVVTGAFSEKRTLLTRRLRRFVAGWRRPSYKFIQALGVFFQRLQ